ncbi:RNase adaptor protein RapZ [Rhodobacterales bacterium 52_120_T64]|nr:RNase adaptor protein RapZ [Rhodobacterales bacterium 52_120_T64]
MSTEPEKPILLITGPAGAGRSTAIHILEDMGYEAIDNLPMYLLPRLLSGGPVERPLAIGIDTRTRGFDPAAILKILDSDTQTPPMLVFVDCDQEILLRRFTETRRRHPAAPDEAPIIGIRYEIGLLQGLRERADILIETTDFSPHELKAEIRRIFDFDQSHNLAISVQSFSYKRGTPRGVDMIIDCRFLQNPHWQDGLRDLNGKDTAVTDFVNADPLYAAFFEQLCNMCHLLLPAYREEGKAHFSIGLGCSGGKHRSVSVTESLAKQLADDGWQVSIRHRELDRQLESLATRKGTDPN